MEKLCVFLVFLSFFASADESSTVRLFDDGFYSLNSEMEIFVDETQNITFDQISSPSYKKSFKKNSGSALNLGLSSSVYWVRVTLMYPDSHPNGAPEKQWLLEVDKALLNVAELYTPNDRGGYNIQTSDLRVPFPDREVSHVNSVFPITLMLGETKTLYLRIQSMTSLHFSLLLWDVPAFSIKVAREEFIYGLFFGCMLTLIIYNAFLNRSLRDEVYFYYVAYLGGIIVFTLLSIGHGFIHFEQFFPSIGKEYVAIVIWGSLGFATMFFKTFLHTKVDHPIIDSVANVFVYISLISGSISFFVRDHVSIIWASLGAVPYLIFFLATSLYCWINGNAIARLLFFGWIFNAVGLISYGLLANQLIPSNALTQIVAPAGIVIEAVLLSFALGARIKKERNRSLFYEKESIDNLRGYESIFHNSLEGRYQMTLAGSIFNANRSLAKMFGLSTVSEVVDAGQAFTLRLFADPEDQYKKLLESGFTENSVCFFDKNNVPVWGHHRATMVIQETKGEGHIEGTVVNITDFVQREVALINEESERLKKGIAKADLEAKSRFLLMMNHRVRTPLTAIVGYSECLKETGGKGENNALCKKVIMDNSRELLQLINNVLDLSKIEAGKFVVDKISLDVLSMLTELVPFHYKKAEEKGLHLGVNLSNDVPSKVISDPMRVAQVLDNLCRNAIAFTEKGSVTIDIFWRDEQMFFSVRDTGIGVPEQLKKALFEVFCGEGVGLALSQRLAEMLGGEVTLENHEGEGSTFLLKVLAPAVDRCRWLSQSDVDAEMDNIGLSEKIRNDLPPKKLAGTVLVAEDNTVNQKLISKVLSKLGVDIVMVSDGLEACDYCDEQLPDMILMDINMPIRDGLAATRYLRDKRYATPVYALTAETDKGELKKAIDAGCQGVLSKPLNSKELNVTLRKHLGCL